MTYALCGFANFGSLGIMLGGLGTMCPERRAEIALYRAVGATAADMRAWMLALAVVVGVLGGAAGLVVARAAALGAGVVAFLMVHPYFAAKKSFVLERSFTYAASNDGKLGFFANVHPTNLTLTSLHHLARPGHADDEIAFPGFTVLALMLVWLLVRARRALGTRDARQLLVACACWALLAALVTSVESPPRAGEQRVLDVPAIRAARLD